MALSWSEKALAAVLGIEAAAGKGPTGRATRAALKAGAKAITAGTIRYAPVAAGGVASASAANPITAGALLGLGTLQTGPGQALLDAAAVRGAADRIAAQQAVDEAVFRATELPQRQFQAAVESPVFKPAVKRKVSKYSKAVKAGMAAVKASKFGGKKGKISNAKSTFATVNKVASAVNKGKKVAKTGLRGVAARAIRRIL
tara:strand:- start:43 stop:645 length:603 start_codon:yes stop_codon:yes gene_type:complete